MASVLQPLAWERRPPWERAPTCRRDGERVQTQQAAFSFLSVVFFGMKFDGIFLGELPSVKDMKRKGWMTGNCQLSFSDQIYKSCLKSTSRKAELRNSYVKRESEEQNPWLLFSLCGEHAC